MKVVVLSSGSKGNTTYVETETTRMLIDIGNSCKYVKERLKELNVDPKSIDGILITHTHKDHIKGLEVFTKQYGTKVYCTDKMFKYIDYIKKKIQIDQNQNINISDIVYISVDYF